MHLLTNITMEVRMNTKTLLAGIVGFILGALLVSVAATTFEKDKIKSADNSAIYSNRV